MNTYSMHKKMNIMLAMIGGLILVQLATYGVHKFFAVKAEKERVQQEIVLKDNLNQAKYIAVDINKELDEAKKKIAEMSKQLNEVKDLARIQKELSLLKPQTKYIVLALGLTEGDWKFDVKHYEWNTTGWGGIRPYYWKDDLQGVDVNSLKAVEIVYLKLLEESKGDKFKALAKYKGAKTNFKSVYLTMKLEKEIKKRMTA